MNDFLFDKFRESTKNLSHYFKGLFFIEPSFLDHLFEITILAKLCDDIQTIFRT